VLCEPDGDWACVACAGADKFAVIDIAKLEITSFLPTGKQPDGMPLPPRGLQQGQ
jgi:hypothetical protein